MTPLPPNTTGPAARALHTALRVLLDHALILPQDAALRHQLTIELAGEVERELFGPVTLRVLAQLRLENDLIPEEGLDAPTAALIGALMRGIGQAFDLDHSRPARPIPRWQQRLTRGLTGLQQSAQRARERVAEVQEELEQARDDLRAEATELLTDLGVSGHGPPHHDPTPEAPATPVPLPHREEPSPMFPIVAPLHPGSTGPDVANLQAALLTLLARDLVPVADSALRAQLVRGLRQEREEARYGDTTRRLVEALQQERGLAGGGTVDRPTAEALNALLEELGLLEEAPPGLVIHGRVRNWDGRPVVDAQLRAEWLPDPLLAGEATTDTEGRYRLIASLPPDDRARTLRVLVFDASGRPLRESPPLEQVGPVMTHNFDLLREQTPGPIVPPPVEPPPAEPPTSGGGAPFRPTVRVHWRNRAPLPGCQVQACDYTLVPCAPGVPAHGAETELARGVTHEDGSCVLPFSWPPAPPAALLPAAATGKPAPDLRLRVHSPEGLELHVSEIFPRAAADLTIEVLLDTDAVRPVVENAALIARLSRRLPDAGRCMAEVPDEALPLLARDTGVDEVQLRRVRDVARLRAAPRGGVAISASTAWALLRSGHPPDPVSWLDLPRADLVAPLRRALDDGWIAPISESGRDPRSPEDRAADAEARAAALSGAMIDSLSQDLAGQERHPFVAVLRIAGTASSARIASWLRHYQGRAPDTEGASWWAGLAKEGFSAEEVGRIQDAHVLYRVLDGDLNALQGVSAQVDPQDGPVSLLAWPARGWEGLLAAAGRTDAMARAQEARRITDAVREVWRSEAQRRALRDRRWGARVFGELRMDDALGLLVDGIAAADQDFTEVTLSSLVEHPALEGWRALDEPARSASLREGEALQRVARVADHPQTLVALWPEFQSAGQIARLPMAALATRLEGTALSEPVEKIHARASERATIAMHMGLQLANYASYGGVAGGASPGDRPVSGDLLENLQLPSAGLQELIGSMAWCACGSCSSVLSPAAYLVDLLALLQQVKNKDGATLEERLLDRRRDIALIPLDCANTNTEVPYIDLMNEAMECLFLTNVLGKQESDLPARFDDGGRSAAEARAMSGFRQTETWDWIARKPRFPATLPYHDGVAAERAWLRQLGTSREEVLQLWADATGGSSPHRLAMETLGLYALEAEWALPEGAVTSLAAGADASSWSLLVVQPREIADVHALFGLPNPAALSDTLRLDRMAAALELDAATLLSRLDLWSYSAQVDTLGVPIRVQLQQEQAAGEIFDCRPDHTWLSVGPSVLRWIGRVRFFERLVKLTGWTPLALDQHLRGRQLLNPYASPELAGQELTQLAAALRLCRGGAELETLTWLGWRPENRPSPEGLTAALPPGVDRPLALRRLLRVSAPVQTAMRAQLNTGLTEPSESEVWDLVRMVSLGRLLDLSPLDVLPLLDLFELKPGPMEPDQLEGLARRWARLSRRGFTVAELRAIWQGKDRGAAALGERQVEALRSTLERQLQALKGKPGAASMPGESQKAQAEAASQALSEALMAALNLPEEVVQALLVGREERLLVLRESATLQARASAEEVLFRILFEARVVSRLGFGALEIEALCLRQAPMGVWPTEPTLQPWWDLVLRWVELRDQVLGGDAGALDVRLAGYGPTATAAERQDLTRPLALRLAALATATGWPSAMIEALVQADTEARGLASPRVFGWADQLSDGATPGLLSRLPELLTLIELGGLSARTGISPQLLGQIYTAMPSMADHDARVASLHRSAQARTPEDKWWDVVRAVHDPLRVARRDALASVLCDGTHGPPHIHAPNRKVRTAAELFQSTYFDPGMGPCQLTTRIRQATIAIQQLVQSVQMGEEPGFEAKLLPTEWTWMRNYRVWEAARKVFLYPEKYYAADLRVGMTEIFRDLIAELGASELDSGAKLALMRRYAERLHDVGNLETLSLWTDTPNLAFSSEQPTHHILARTHAAPHRYFYRAFREEEEWTPWESVPVTPEGVHTMLIRVEQTGPLWLMWFTFEDRPVANDPRTKEQKEVDPEPPMEWWITPFWSEKTEDGWGETKRGETVRVPAVYGEDDNGVYARVSELEVPIQAEYNAATRALMRFLFGSSGVDAAGLTIREVLDGRVEFGDTVRTFLNDPSRREFGGTEGATNWMVWEALADVLDTDTPPTTVDLLGGLYWQSSFDNIRGNIEGFGDPSVVEKIKGAVLLKEFFGDGESTFERIRLHIHNLTVAALGEIEPWNQYIKREKRRTEDLKDARREAQSGLPGRRASYSSHNLTRYLNPPTIYTPITNGRRISLVPVHWHDAEPTRLVIDLKQIGAHWVVEPCRGTVLHSDPLGVHAHRNVPRDADNDGSRVESKATKLSLSMDVKSVENRSTAIVLSKQGVGTFARKPTWGTSGPFSDPALTFQGKDGSWLVTRTGDQGPDFFSTSDVNGILPPGQALRGSSSKTKQFSDHLPVPVMSDRKDAMMGGGGASIDATLEKTIAWTPWSRPWLRFWAYHHPYACDLSQSIRQGGPEALYRWDVQRLGEPREPQKAFEPEIGYLFYRAHGPSEATVSRWYPEQKLDFRAGGACSVYNWELYLHLPLLLAETYHDAGRYEDELEVLTWLLDPLARPTAGDPVEAKVPEARAWRLMPLHDHVEQQDIATRLRALSDPAYAKTTQGMATLEAMRLEIASWRRDPFDVWRILGARPAGIKRLLFYRRARCRLAMCDKRFRQISGPNGMEEVALAHQGYIQLQREFGQRPQGMPELKGGAGLTWKELRSQTLDPFQNLAVALETHIVSTVPVGGGAPQPLMQLYFCVPPDPDLLKLWDTVEDRLWKIRNCRDIDGVARTYPIWGIEIDPMLLVRARALGLDFDEVLAALAQAPTSPRRFTALLAAAKGMVSHLMSLQGAWLSAREKRAAEELNQLRSQQEVALTRAIIDIKKTAVSEARTSLSALRQVQTSVQMKIAYYERLLGERGEDGIPMSGYESSSLSKQKEAGEKAKDATRRKDVFDAIMSAGTSSISTISGATPSVGTTLTVAGGFLSGGVKATLAGLQSFEIDDLRADSARADALGKYQRRQQEWQQALDQARIDLRKVERDLDAQDLRVQITEHDLRNSDLQNQHAREVLAHYQNRFTNAELYRKMDARLATLHRQAQELAEGMVRRAANQVQFELGQDFVAELTPAGTQPRGLLRGEELMNDLLRIETNWMEADKRRLELTKEVALSRIAPEALLQLRHGLAASFALTEELFDRDYPGHTDRRIKTVSLSIPCVAGPYTGVHATLRLAGDSAPVSAIATSTGRDDSGMFQLDLRDERYLPFEGARVASSWTLEMPQEDNAFDLRSIADVVMRLSFTARLGDEDSRAAALARRRSASTRTEGADATLFGLRADFPERWAEMRRRATFKDLEVLIPKDRLPFRKGEHEVIAVALQLIRSSDSAPLPTGWAVNKLGDGGDETEPTLSGDLVRLKVPTLQLRFSGAWGTSPKDNLADIAMIVWTRPPT